MPYCGAKTKRTGNPCRQPAMRNGRCRLHGGKTPRGVASANFKHGRFSQLPERLAARYKEALADPDLVTNISEIALVTVRLNELFQKIDLQETGSLWTELAELRLGALAANKRGDQRAQSNLFNDILDLINRGAEDWQTWREIGTEIDRRSRLAESQSRIVRNQAMAISYEKFAVFLGLVLHAIEEHVPDKATIGKIRETLDSPVRGLLSGTTRDFGIA